jgi:uncharacterized alpha-E superfamily protein
VVGPQAFALYETAAALERAEASARVLGARARASRRSLGDGRGVFAALAGCAPEGLVPARGTGAAHLLRYLDCAAQAGVAAGSALPEEVVDALAWAVGETRLRAAGSEAMDPQEVSRTVRRQIAAIRGLVAHTMWRDGAWELLRLGTYLPRAGWVAALLGASARLARDPDWGGGAPWTAAASITGADAMGSVTTAEAAAERLLLDDRFAFSVAFSAAEVEAALFTLERTGAAGAGALAMARAAHTELRGPEVMPAVAAGDMPGLIDTLLDRIGAVAAAAVPSRADARGERMPAPVEAFAGATRPAA